MKSNHIFEVSYFGVFISAVRDRTLAQAFLEGLQELKCITMLLTFVTGQTVALDQFPPQTSTMCK